jgi:hypothetical protein
MATAEARMGMPAGPVFLRRGTPETRVTFAFNGDDVTVGRPHRYFDYCSSDEDVVRTNAYQTVPAFVASQWSVLDIPLADFSLTSRSHLAQLIISSPNAPTVFVDNVLFHR